MVPRLTVLSCLFLTSSAQLLHLTPGRILGFDYETKKGPYAEVFLNIPYASAPVGELRFEKPIPPKPWKDIRDGTKFGSSCYPVTPDAVVPPEQPSEDCLTLNLIRPKKEAPSPGFPILFWVHGGGYEFGSAIAYGYKGLADIYIPRDIIVVTIQYRLGVYGFFSTGDSRMPGNLGLFDMAEALKFIHTNAESFGGDPSRITVWGHSAGSAAVGQLILSPVTRDYIPRSIEMSGSTWASFAQGAAVANYSLELAQVELFLKWAAVIDGEFLQHPDEMTAAAPPKVSLIGLTNKEAALFTIKRVAPFMHKFGVDPSDYPNWNRDRLIAELKKIVQRVYSGNHLEQVMKEIIDYYVNREEVKEFEFYINRYTEFLSDLLFVVPTVEGLLARRDAGWDIYAYSLEHYNDATWNKDVPKKLRGPAHGCEFPYTKGTHFVENIQEGEANAEEQVITEVFQQSFIEFVKIGAPSNDHEVWLDVGTDANIRYLLITPNPQMKQGFCNESTAFWHRIREYGFDMVQLLPTQKSSMELKEEL
ncbi:Carboxylesterase [Ancylostoma caninum]|uniref:Carboxylic ester hydrolase n=1 Tax=Ancylostoma caninum TaxID=29170 RepID=A0A368FR12_ANCCA|nr:Carboxylesterase [Ancylostoma caninum]